MKRGLESFGFGIKRQCANSAHENEECSTTGETISEENSATVTDSDPAASNTFEATDIALYIEKLIMSDKQKLE